MIDKLPEIQIHSCAKINEKLNEVIDWINDVSALRVTDKQVTANLPNIDAGELAFLSKENAKLKDEIDRLETELKRTRKALEQSEICCTEWEKQALDYKAENIALSGDLECTRKALDKAKWWLHEIVENHRCTPISTAEMALKEITALEQKDR